MIGDRALRGKRLRGALYIAAGGRCQACGVELGAAWHADHVIPWSVTKRTNIHEMQALCPHCNLRKGSKLEKTNRSFQDEFILRAEEVCRTGEKMTTAHVTPGGGKTRGALLFAKTLIGLGAVDAVTYVGPRISLLEQIADAVNEVIPGKSLRVADNSLPLMRDKWEIGYVTTIQAVTANPEIHEHHAERRRTLLIVDEFHHYPGEDTESENASWSRAIKQLARRALFVLAMTGTVYRNKDSRGILWLEYGDDRTPLPCHIEYGRRSGIEEGAKLRFQPILFAGPASFDREGVRIDTRIESPDARVSGSMTWELAGNKPFVLDSVLQGVAHWQQERAVNQRAQALVVCRRQGIAREVFSMLKEAGGYRVALAISDEDEGAQAAVKAYRKRGVDILVSVDKAYEGLDAPATTHVICMRGVESQPWLEQCLDRATRIDYLEDGTPNPNKRLAYFFSTATPGMVEVLSRIEEEQGDALPEPKEPAGGGRPGEERFPESDLLWAEIDQLVTREGSPEDQARKLILEKYGREGTAEQIHAFGQAIALMQEKMARRDEIPAPDPGREKELRKEISRAARRRDYHEDLELGATNLEIVEVFGKRRPEMGVAELEEVLDWLDAEHAH